MSRFRDEAELEAELRAMRPQAEPEFTAALDERAAAGFPRRSRLGGGRLSRLASHLRSLSPRRVALPAAATAFAAIVIATAVVAIEESGTTESTRLAEPRDNVRPGAERRSDLELQSAAPPTIEGTGASAGGAIGEPTGGAAPAGRAIERSAQLVLVTDADRVSGDAEAVFDVVRVQRGIVRRSQIEEGEEPRAEFELLIPSRNLGEAMAALSSIATVTSRRDATADLTAPTTGAADRVAESRARIESLLDRIAAATTTDEREAAEAELRRERRRLAVHSAWLRDLRRQARFSAVSLRIEADRAGTAWGPAEALDDAGRILSIAAAVCLIALAILAPLAALCLLAWLTRRAWVQWRRRQALG